MKQGNSLVTLVIVLLAVMLAAYLGVYAWDSFTDPFTTTLTYSYTANDSLEADGWVVREEQLLPAQSGILDITRAEGEEVGRGQTVALVHQNSQALDVQAQMEELAMEIELLDYAMNQTGRRRLRRPAGRIHPPVPGLPAVRLRLWLLPSAGRRRDGAEKPGAQAQLHLW